MERQTITVDIAPGNNQIQRLKSSQGDIGRPLGVYITQNGVALDCSAYTADLYILKPDGNYFTATATVDATEHNLITWETAKQETPVAGDCAAQIRILSNGDDVGTARFVEYVEASPGFVGESSESVVESLMEYVRQAATSAETASGAASSASGSASAASGSASSAAQSASAAAGSASTAHTDAETASQAAQTAQDVAASIPEDYSTLSEDVTGLKSAFEQLDANVITESAGPASIISIADGADGMPMRKVEVAIEPVQDLHGYDAPWPAGGSVNKLPLSDDYSLTNNGVTCKVVNGVITLSGTASGGSARFELPLHEAVDLSPSTNKIAFLNSFVQSNVTMYFTRGSANIHYWGMSSANRVVSGWTQTENETVDKIIVVADSGANVNGTISPMLIALTESDPTTFTPYSNICPISGWTGAKVTRTGINIWDEEWELGDINIYNGEKVNGSLLISKNHIPVCGNTKYYWKSSYGGVRYFYDLQKNFVGYVYSTANATFTTPANAKYMKFREPSNYGTTYNHDISINYPATNTEYHAYQGQTYEVTFPTEAGTVYGGTLDVVSGKLVVDRMEWTAPKTGWSLYKSGAGSTIHYCNLPSETIDVILNAIANRFYSISDTFAYYTKQLSWYSDMPDCHYVYNVSGVSVSKRVWIRYEGNDFEDVIEGAKFIFMLQTPQAYTLTTQEIKTLLGINSIWADAGNTAVTYPADTKLYIDKKIAELQALILENNG